MSNELIQIETPFQFSDENQRKFDKLIQHYPVKEAAMLPTLHLAQKQEGYISPAVMEHVAELLELPVMKVKDVVHFTQCSLRNLSANMSSAFATHSPVR